MADLKISGLPASTTPLAGTEVLPIVQSSTTKQVSVANLTAGRAVSALSVSAPTIGAGSGSALAIQSNATTGATMDTSQNIGFGTANLNGYYGSGSVVTRMAIAYANSSTDPNAATKGLVIRNDDPTTSNVTELVFGTQNTGNTPIASAAIWSVNDARTSGYGTGSLHFGTVGGSGIISDRGNFSAAGDFTVSTGNVIQGTAAKGINFTANSKLVGATSQLLNWYEKGAYTPTDLSGAGLTLTNNGSFYIRIGDQVSFWLDVTYPSTADTSGMLISVPYTPGADAGGSIGYTTYSPANPTFVQISSGGNGVRLQSGGGGTVTNAAMSTKRIQLSGTYIL